MSLMLDGFQGTLYALGVLIALYALLIVLVLSKDAPLSSRFYYVLDRTAWHNVRQPRLVCWLPKMSRSGAGVGTAARGAGPGNHRLERGRAAMSPVWYTPGAGAGPRHDSAGPRDLPLGYLPPQCRPPDSSRPLSHREALELVRW